MSTGNDREFWKLIKCVEEKSIDHKDADMRKYSNIFNELAVVFFLIFLIFIFNCKVLTYNTYLQTMYDTYATNRTILYLQKKNLFTM